MSTVAGQSGSAHPFTCNTCQVAFRSGDLQRTHMQSDWHRYNLKRRVASLPPLTSEIFAEKVIANKATAAATAARASFEKRCEPCDKSYYSEGAYVNHLGSQKHKLLVARFRGFEGGETDSMADSTFTMGDTLETASTVTVGDVAAEEEFDEVVEAVKNAKIEEPVDPVARPQHPTPTSAAQHGEPSRKLRTGESDDEDDEDTEEEEDDYDHKANVNQCLFCNYVSPTLDLNVNHMSKQHGCFIPETEYLVDLPGLINYLSETVVVLRQCLYCHKQLHTDTGIQTHMRDRGHCMIAYGTEDEQMDIGEFYDFSSTYSDDESEDGDGEASGGVSLGVKRAAKTTVKNADGEDVDMEEDDEGWESDASSLSSVPTDEITSVPIDHDHRYKTLDQHKHHSRTDPRPHKNNDGYHSHSHQGSRAAYHDDYELHLPTGRTAGHRSLKAYYRQNLRNYPSAEERAQQAQARIDSGRHVSDDEEEKEDRDRRGRQIVSRANGGTGMIGVSEEKKREVKALEKRMQKQQRKAEADYQWGNNRRGNFQKHFRDHLLQ